MSDDKHPNLTGGSRKGIPNKATAALKAAVLAAFDRVGGEDYLVRVAEDDPKTFCVLLGKILPTTMVGDPDNPIRSVSRLEVVLVRSENRDSGNIRAVDAADAVQGRVGRTR